MPRPRPPHLVRQVTRHGRAVWYFRRGKGPRIRMPGDYGSAEFRAAYDAALAGALPAAPRRPGTGTVRWLIDRYRETSAWADLSSATRRARENIFRHVVERIGDMPAAAITRADVVASRDARRDTPAAARNMLDTLRGLYRWAVDAGLTPTDPTAGVKNPRRPKGDGFAPWTPADLAAFEARWPLGTRERLAYAVLLYTGLRRGDAVRIGRFHESAGCIRIRTEKTGEPVLLPILPPLRQALDAGPTGETTWVATAAGRPTTKESFGNFFSEAARAAGVAKSAHGLRKAAATRAAEAGATVAELEALFGWRGGGMAALYTDTADRERLARSGAQKLNR